jgi:hypothetical protein
VTDAVKCGLFPAIFTPLATMLFPPLDTAPTSDPDAEVHPGILGNCRTGMTAVGQSVLQCSGCSPYAPGTMVRRSHREISGDDGQLDMSTSSSTDYVPARATATGTGANVSRSALHPFPSTGRTQHQDEFATSYTTLPPVPTNNITPLNTRNTTSSLWSSSSSTAPWGYREIMTNTSSVAQGAEEGRNANMPGALANASSVTNKGSHTSSYCGQS